MAAKELTRYLRRIHMYLALYLTPWVVVYALSSLYFNHAGTVAKWYGGNPHAFEKVEEIEYKNAFAANAESSEAAQQILLDLDLDGPHVVRGNLQDEKVIIIRQELRHATRITYGVREGTLTVEKQKPTLPGMLVRMHTRHGFGHDYLLANVWGVLVEITALAFLFWIASGMWLWWTIKPARRWGALSALCGLGLFGILLFNI